jgi:hypothetical protein
VLVSGPLVLFTVISFTYQSHPVSSFLLISRRIASQ